MPFPVFKRKFLTVSLIYKIYRQIFIQTLLQIVLNFILLLKDREFL